MIESKQLFDSKRLVPWSCVALGLMMVPWWCLFSLYDTWSSVPLCCSLRCLTAIGLPKEGVARRSGWCLSCLLLRVLIL